MFFGDHGQVDGWMMGQHIRHAKELGLMNDEKEQPGNAPGNALRLSKGKPEFFYLLSWPRALKAVCADSTFGASKYALYNYKKGAPASESVRCILSHLSEWWNGGEYVIDAQKLGHRVHILGAVAWNALRLADEMIAAAEEGWRPELDDRPHRVIARNELEERLVEVRNRARSDAERISRNLETMLDGFNPPEHTNERCVLPVENTAGEEPETRTGAIPDSLVLERKWIPVKKGNPWLRARCLDNSKLTKVLRKGRTYLIRFDGDVVRVKTLSGKTVRSPAHGFRADRFQIERVYAFAGKGKKR